MCQLPWKSFSKANTVQRPVETGRKLKTNTVQRPVEINRSHIKTAGLCILVPSINGGYAYGRTTLRGQEFA